MKKNISAIPLWALVVVVLSLAVLSCTAFRGGLVGTAHAFAEPTCSDGQPHCGVFGAVTAGDASCAINGKANNGGYSCSTADSTTIIGGPDQQGWFVLTKNSVTIPSNTTWGGDTVNYNPSPIYDNSPVSINYGAVNAGSVSVGTASASHDLCTPFAIGKAGCKGGWRDDVSGTASPGDVVNFTVNLLGAPDNNMNSTCTVGTTCGIWAQGDAMVSVQGVTACFRSTNLSSPWIDPNKTSLGRRNYVVSANGVCTPNNLPPDPPKIAISEVSAGTLTNPIIDNITGPTTHDMNVSNVGGSPMTWFGVLDKQSYPWVTSPDFGGVAPLTLKSKPAWLDISEADGSLSAGGSALVDFALNHGQIGQVGLATSGVVEFDCPNCAGPRKLTDTVNYLVPAPSFVSTPTASSPVQSGSQTTLSWSANNANATTPVQITMCTNTVSPSACTGGTLVGNFAANGTANVRVDSPSAFKLTVKGLSDQVGAVGNTVSQTVYVGTTVLTSPSCSANPASVTLPTGGGSVSATFTGQSDAANTYQWSTDGTNFGAATTNAFVTSFTTVGQKLITVKSTNGLTAGCVVTVNAPAGVPSMAMSIKDNTKNVTISDANTTGNFSVGDSWTITVTTSNILANTIFGLCNTVVDCSSQTLATVSSGIGTWTLSGTFAVSAVGSYTEFAQTPLSSPTVTSNNVHFKVAAASAAFSCTVSANPMSVTSGNTSAITWSSSPNAAGGCTATGAWSGAKAGSGSFTTPGLASNSTYSMSCLNPATGLAVTCTPVTVIVSQATNPLTCSPASQSVNRNSLASFDAAGGTGSNYLDYSWLFPGGSSPFGSNGAVNGASYSSVGSYIATVTNGGSSASCSVTVGNPPGSSLFVTDFHLTDAAGTRLSSFSTGQDIYPSVTIRNNGPAATNGTIYTGIYSNTPNTIVNTSTPSDINVWATESGSIPAGQSKTYSITSNAVDWTNDPFNNQSHWTMLTASNYVARAFVDNIGYVSNDTTAIPSRQETAAYQVSGPTIALPTSNGFGCAITNSCVAVSYPTTRYLKINVPSSASWVAFHEIQVFGGDGNQIAIPASNVTVSNGAGGNALVDGNLGTVWNQGFYSGWALLDLGSSQPVSRVSLYTEASPNPALSTYQILGSTNGTTFIPLGSVTEPIPSGMRMDFTFPSASFAISAIATPYTTSTTGFYATQSDCSATCGASPISVSVAPSSASLAPGVSQQFTATVQGSGTFNPGVTWSASRGTVDQAGNYVAPASAGVDTVTAISKQDVTKSGLAAITVTAAPTNSVSLSVSPSSTDIGNTVNLTATVTGTAVGTINYTFWWNCSNATTSVQGATAACGDPTASSTGAKFNGQALTSKSALHVYGAVGTYTPKVIVERGLASPSQGQSSLSATSIHLECVNNACTSVAGSGVNRCGNNADCSGVMHAVCDAVNSACVNAAGPGANACSSDPACGGVGLTHLTCETNSCVIVGGSGINGCEVPGSPCVLPPTLNFSVTPSSLTLGESANATWSSTHTTSCTASSSPVEGDWAVGSGKATSSASGQPVTPSPPVGVTSETYSLTCTGPGGSLTKSATLTVNAPPPVSCSSFNASSSSITPPGQSTLSWQCLNAASCTINGTSMSNPNNGSVVVAPTSTTQYLLLCQAPGGRTSATSSVTVTVTGSGIHEINP